MLIRRTGLIRNHLKVKDWALLDHTLRPKGNPVQKIFAKNTSVISGFLILVNEYSLTFEGKKGSKSLLFSICFNFYQYLYCGVLLTTWECPTA